LLSWAIDEPVASAAAIATKINVLFAIILVTPVVLPGTGTDHDRKTRAALPFRAVSFADPVECPDNNGAGMAWLCGNAHNCNAVAATPAPPACALAEGK
jgi:hypothetical protein